MSRLISINLIDPSPWADLFPHDEEHVARLAADIAERGVQTPLHLFPLGNGRFELLCGHDRLEGARRSGKTEVPAEFRSTLTDEEERFAHFVRDNTLRKDVDKRAIARVVVLRHPDWSDRRVAEAAGVSHPTVAAARADLVEAGLVESLTTRVGSNGVAQAASKPEQPKAPEDAPAQPARAKLRASNTTTTTIVGGEVVPAEDFQESVVDELAHADAEIRRLHALVDSLVKDDLSKEILAWSLKFDQLNGRLQAEVTAANAARDQAKRQGMLLVKIRKALGVEKDSEILPALEARQAA